ncbi:MAG: hypothetical protein M3336_13115, partial [Chloroflexota bacterium]|nr:hypothetical protein [Chloroflexota bacterium]
MLRHLAALLLVAAPCAAQQPSATLEIVRGRFALAAWTDTVAARPNVTISLPLLYGLRVPEYT